MQYNNTGLKVVSKFMAANGFKNIGGCMVTLKDEISGACEVRGQFVKEDKTIVVVQWSGKVIVSIEGKETSFKNQKQAVEFLETAINFVEVEAEEVTEVIEVVEQEVKIPAYEKVEIISNEDYIKIEASLDIIKSEKAFQHEIKTQSGDVARFIALLKQSVKLGYIVDELALLIPIFTDKQRIKVVSMATEKNKEMFNNESLKLVTFAALGTQWKSKK